MRPILEYSCTAAQKDIDRLEAAQRRAARFTLNRHREDSVRQANATGARRALPGTPPKDSKTRHAVKNQQRPRSSQVPTLEAATPENPANPHLHFREDTLPCRLPPHLVLPQDSEGLEHPPSRDGLSPPASAPLCRGCPSFREQLLHSPTTLFVLFFVL